MRSVIILGRYLIEKNDRYDLGSLTTQEWLNTRQAATYLNVSVGSLMNMASTGSIPHYKLGRRNRYRTEDLRDLLLAQKRGGSYVDKSK